MPSVEARFCQLLTDLIDFGLRRRLLLSDHLHLLLKLFAMLLQDEIFLSFVLELRES